jgi:hypothetical protein
MNNQPKQIQELLPESDLLTDINNTIAKFSEDGIYISQISDPVIKAAYYLFNLNEIVGSKLWPVCIANKNIHHIEIDMNIVIDAVLGHKITDLWREISTKDQKRMIKSAKNLLSDQQLIEAYVVYQKVRKAFEYSAAFYLEILSIMFSKKNKFTLDELETDLLNFSALFIKLCLGLLTKDDFKSAILPLIDSDSKALGILNHAADVLENKLKNVIYTEAAILNVIEEAEEEVFTITSTESRHVKDSGFDIFSIIEGKGDRFGGCVARSSSIRFMKWLEENYRFNEKTKVYMKI